MGNACCKDSSDESTKSPPSNEHPYQAMTEGDYPSMDSPPKRKKSTIPAESPARFRSPGTDILYEDDEKTEDTGQGGSESTKEETTPTEEANKDTPQRIDQMDSSLLDGDDDDYNTADPPITPKMRLVTDAHGNEYYEVEDADERDGVTVHSTEESGSAYNTMEPPAAPATRIKTDAHGNEVIVSDLGGLVIE